MKTSTCGSNSFFLNVDQKKAYVAPDLHTPAGWFLYTQTCFVNVWLLKVGGSDEQDNSQELEGTASNSTGI